MPRSASIVGVIAAALSLVFVPASPGVVGSANGTSPNADNAMPALYKNCTNFSKKYPHGVGRVGARDKTSGVPVTTFRRSNRIFAIAMSWNRGLDRDKDRIACEKR